MTLPRYPRPRSADAPFATPPRLASLPPVCPVENLDGRRAWLVSGFAEARALAADRRLSSDPTRPGYPDSHAGTGAATSRVPLVQMDAPEHAHWRRLVARDFSAAAARALRPRIDEIVDGLIDDVVAAGSGADLVSALATPTPTLVVCELLGVPVRDRELFRRYAEANFRLTTDRAELTDAFLELMSNLSELVEEKLAAPADDVLSRIAVRQGGESGMSHEDFVSFACMLLVTGTESTARILALSIVALLTHPGQWQTLADGDESTVDTAVEELLRFLPISTGMGRAVTAPVDIAGCRLAPGDGVILNFDQANRDPAVYESADELDVRRDGRAHLAFGHGPHLCLGRHLAREEMRSVLGGLARRLPGLRLAGTIADLRFRNDSYLYGVDEVAVVW